MPAALLLCLLSTACLDERVVECSDGRMCPAGAACDEAHHGCVFPQQLESCANKTQGTKCSYRGVAQGACYEEVCLPAGCGNAILDAQEACDDGNRFHGDGCSADCWSNERCGNGKTDVSVGETCDIAKDPSKYCRANCVSVRCGDGTVDQDAFELCDDGPKNSDAKNAHCRPNCQPQRCGDGIVDSDEVCDDGNPHSGDGCSADCQSKETCGNGIVDEAAGETCDTGVDDSVWCRSNCVQVTCGDHKLDPEVFEECDNGDENSDKPNAPCRLDCHLRRCGDGIKDDGEVCDDGNYTNGDGCSHDCRSLERCGNGYTDAVNGETCDDGNFVGHDGCSSRCLSEVPVWRNIEGIIPSAGPVAYDATRDVIVLFGQSGLFELRSTGWQRLTPLRRPPNLRSPGLTWDSRRHRVVMFGGAAPDGYGTNATWEWDGRQWEERNPISKPPSVRFNAVLTYDPARGRSILFGGTGADGWLPDTWEWDGNDWMQISASGGPPAGTYGASTYDPVAGSVVTFDGTSLWYQQGSTWRSVPAVMPIAEPASGSERGLVFDASRGRLVYRSPGSETDASFLLFEWDGSTWLSLPSPPRRYRDAKLVYRSARRRLALLEGLYLNEWGGGTWQGRSTYDAPAPQRNSSAMVYDALRGETVLFGGYGQINGSGDYVGLSDTWVWDGAFWSLRTPRTVPPGRWYHAMAYDGLRRSVVMFGGDDDTNVLSMLGDTWLWDGEDWRQAHPESAPAERTQHAMTYDAARGQVVLFGGGQYPSVQDDLWTWDGHTWTERVVANPPSPRVGHGLSYDPIRREVVTVAGFDGLDPPADRGATFTWNGERWQQADVPRLLSYWGFAMPYDANRKTTLIVGGQLFDFSEVLEHVQTWSWAALPTGDRAREWQVVPVTRDGPTTVLGHNAVYDTLRGCTVAFNTGNGWPTWELSYRAEDELYEVCQHGFDIDGDGLVGCADPDCWGYCTPLCPPGTECDDSLPHCGDGTCNTALETCRMCPGDCGACGPLCGDFLCDPGESIASCPGDCTNPLAASP